jgi:hypothetical protein
MTAEELAESFMALCRPAELNESEQGTYAFDEEIKERK